MKQLNLQNILLILLAGIFIFKFFIDVPKDEEPKPVQIIIPEMKGSTHETIENVKVIPIEIPGQGPIYVDERWKDDYLNAKDSIERLNKYLEAIQVKDKQYTFVDNDTLSVVGNLKTRGDLIEYNIDWKVKERIFEYTPQVVGRYPKFAISGEIDAGVPTTPTSNFLMRGSIGLHNKRGEALKVGYDTDKRVWFGVSKAFPIVK